MQKVIITNIQKYSVHDGPGIRTTVFFKGCPLSCLWCHNPETQSFTKQLMYDAEKCTGCFRCINVCPQGAISVQGNKVVTDTNKCNACGKCTDSCVNLARDVSGNEYSVQELMAEIEKDKIFYEQSGGGVTLSGGECMVNIDFIEEVIARCYRKGIPVVVDTCGYVPYENFKRINSKVEMYLYDIKHMDPEKHKKFIGQDNKLILDNLKKLSDDGAKINLRLPLIDGVNTDEENIRATIEMAKKLNIYKVSLLAYHDIGKGKYYKLNRTYSEDLLNVPSKETMDWIKCEFEKNNFDVSIGG